jgi:general secretion pathway protein J
MSAPRLTRLGSWGPRSARRSRAGFTLLELLVAIALLGVLAVLCWRGLESVLSSRDRLTRESEGLRALTIAFAQVDDDLRRTWAVRTIPAVARAVRFLSVDDRLVLELARLGGTASDPTRIDRVVWRLRADTLERGVAANVADGANATGELVWQPVLAGVKCLQWRAWPSGQGWQTGYAMAATMASQDASIAAPSVPAPDPSTPATGRSVEAPILGVELSVERADGARFVRVYSVRD